jgi:ribosomal protein S27AE
MAWGLSDLIALMDRWGIWKEVRSNAEKVPSLERRITALEQRLQRAPGEACPKCGALEFRTERTVQSNTHFAALGALDRHLKCGACAYTEVRTEDPDRRRW